MDLKTFLEKNYSIDSLNKVILDLSNAAIKISNSIRNNYKLENKKETSQNADGDKQKPLDIFADECVFESLNNSSVAAYCSEEQDGMTTIDKNGKYLIFCDPLDGSSNIGNNISIGTIFSILPFYNGSIENSLKQNGNSQLCAGFFVYGPQTTLILSLGKGVHSFYFDNKNSQFNILNPNIIIPKSTSEFSINSSYRRYWNDKIKNYIKNCEDGSDGIREKNFNMRWVGSLVADASRIFERGGIFLYPQDKREKNKSGRLRLTYEANPISFLISQAGGKATNGSIDILNVEVNEIHQRVPFIFGSEEEVDIFLNTE